LHELDLAAPTNHERGGQKDKNAVRQQKTIGTKSKAEEADDFKINMHKAKRGGEAQSSGRCVFKSQDEEGVA